MAYKFLKITFYYRTFLKDYYSRKPEIKGESYNQQFDDLMSEAFGWADFFKVNMEKLGNEANEIVWNVSSMQNAWARENNIIASGSDILLAQIKKINPEVIFFQDSVSFSPEFIRKIRKEVPAVRLMIGWLCAPSSEENLKTFKEFDFVCGCSPEFTNYLSGKGIRNYELNHAFESTILDRIIPTGERSTDLIFAGSFIGSSDFHEDRLRLFEELIRAGINIRLHTSIDEISPLRLKLVQGGYILSRILDKVGFKKSKLGIPGIRKVAGLNEMPSKINYSEEFRKAVKSTVFGIDMFKEIASAKAGLNIHGGVAGDYAANSRMFEITGMGALLITDNKKNITDFFIPGQEVIVYDSIEDCKDKIRWIFNNPEQMKNIAKAGQARTLKEHTFYNRVLKLDKIIKEHLRK